MTEEIEHNFLARWARFFIRRYKVTILLLVAILVGGLWGVSKNQRQDFPSIPTNFILVTAVQVGASAPDIEQNVIIPIEQSISSLDGMKNLRSSSSKNTGTVFAEMEDVLGTPAAATEMEDLVSNTDLPAGVETTVEVIDAIGPSIVLAVIDGDLTKDELLQQAATIQNRLETSSSDIKRVDIAPENDFQVNVVLQPDELASRGLTYAQVKVIVTSYITALPGGSVQAGGGRTNAISIEAPVTSLDELRALKIGTATLDDVANITRDSYNGKALTVAGFVKDGEPRSEDSVYLMVYKTDDGDIIRISDAVKKELTDIENENVLAEGVEIMSLYDSSPFIEGQIQDLSNNGYIGLVVILIVLLFFINLRTSIVVALIIPIAFLVTFFVLFLIGFSINILTLFAMILTLGILVDNAIVIAEGVVHNMQERRLSKMAAIMRTIRNIGPAVTAATVTTVIAFIPFASIGGIVGEFMKYIPFTIIIMLTASYFLAMTITPVLAWWLFREKGTGQEEKPITTWQRALIIPAIVKWGQCVVGKMSEKYAKVMKRIYASLRARVAVIVVTILLIVASVGIFGRTLEFEQFPTNDGNVIQGIITLPTGTPFEEYETYALDLVKHMATLPYFESAYVFQGQIFAQFTQPQDRPDEMTIFQIVGELNEKIDPIRDRLPEEGKIEVNTISYGPPAAQFDVTVEFIGDDLAVLAAATADLESFVRDKNNVDEVYNSQVKGKVSSVAVTFNDDDLARLGVDPLVASGTINATFAETPVGSIVTRADGVSDDVALLFADDAKDSVDDLRNLLVPSAARVVVKLSEVAAVDEVQTLNTISRLHQKRVAELSVDLGENGDPRALEQSIKEYLTGEKLDDLGLERDSVVYGGVTASQSEDFENLSLVFILAMLFVYIVLVYQFNSYGQPFIIMFTVPIALIGVFPGLHFVGSTLNMISGLGVIALVGIVVNDAIIFFDYMNRYRRENPDLPIGDILVKTGYTRFKPIFSTSITTIGGVLPITLADPFWAGLGTSIISGLVFSTVGTLIAIPVVYSFFVRKI